MELRTLARPYAKAVFELARDADSARKAWSTALAAIAGALEISNVGRLLQTPAVSREQVAQIVGDALLEKAGASADHLPPVAQLRGLLRLLAINHRLSLVPAIAAEFETLRERAESRVDVHIVTAQAEVPAAQRAVLETALNKRLERRVSVQWESDPELVSGALIRAGDLVIDGSVRGELQRLSQALAH